LRLDFELVDADVVISPAGVENVVGLVPCESSATNGFLGLVVNIVGVDGNLSDDLFDGVGGEVEHLDTVVATNDEPVELLGEEDNVDGRFAVLGADE